jgi:hypothetical protein
VGGFLPRNLKKHGLGGENPAPTLLHFIFKDHKSAHELELGGL